MSMADLFMDADSALDQLRCGVDHPGEREELCALAQDSLRAIAERIAPGEEHDIDGAIILPQSEQFPFGEERDEAYAAAERAIAQYRVHLEKQQRPIRGGAPLPGEDAWGAARCSECRMARVLARADGSLPQWCARHLEAGAQRDALRELGN